MTKKSRSTDDGAISAQARWRQDIHEEEQTQS